ncbi:hypothetical protein OKW36_006832 [Paraburkholderia sp. MM5482-R1]
MLRRELESSQFRRYFSIFEMNERSPECDMLIMPMRLERAVSVAARNTGLSASAIVVFSESLTSWPLNELSLSFLRRKFQAGSVSFSVVPAGERGVWLETVLAALSEDTTLDVALYSASLGQEREKQRKEFPTLAQLNPVDLPPPLVFAYRQFLDGARGSITAKRIVKTYRHVEGQQPPVVEQYGRLKSAQEVSVKWHPDLVATLSAHLQEIAGAAFNLTPIEVRPERTTLEVGRAAHSQTQTRRRNRRLLRKTTDTGEHEPLRAGVRLEHIGAAQMAARDSVDFSTLGVSYLHKPDRLITLKDLFGDFSEPIEPAVASERRYVSLELSKRLSQRHHERARRMRPSTKYRAEIFIGPIRVGTLAATRPFDDALLPAEQSEHRLMVVFIPLWSQSDGSRTEPQTRTIALPRTGDSSRAVFNFMSPAMLTSTMARLIVLHQNRVLQTVLVMADIDKDGAARLLLTVESYVSPDFGEETVSPHFDAALIVSDAAGDSSTALTAITPASATFFVPEGLDVLLADIRNDLSALNAPANADEEPITGLDDDRMCKLVHSLAMRGAGLAKELRRQAQLGSLLVAPKIQVIESASGAYFPIEFIYDGPAPAPLAKRCVYGLEALLDSSVHARCPNRADGKTICLSAFWGFSRCIERQPSDGRPEYRLSQPLPKQDFLQPLTSALLAASKRVRPLDLDAPRGVASVLSDAGVSVERASSWVEWQSKIAAGAPALLVLLPHSLESLTTPHLPALEISGDTIESVRMDEGYVRCSSLGTPIVLLLGCSNALPQIPFLSFVREFRFNGAAITIGTLATIRGRQTVDFIRELITELQAASSAERTFDEVFLLVKQRMLANGNPFVLSLVAYGNTGWRIHH